MKRFVLIRFNLLPLLISCLAVLAGCQSVATYHAGSRVAAGDSVAMQVGGPHQDVWESFEMVIPYTYERRGDLLEISAAARLGDHYRWLYTRLNRLHLYLYFLDAENVVVSTALLTSTFRQPAYDLIEFRRTLTVPARAVAFSFGYEGAVSEFEEFATFDKRPYR